MFSVGKQLVALASLPLATAGLALPAPAAVPAPAPTAAVATFLPTAAPTLAAVPIEADVTGLAAAAPAVSTAAPIAAAGNPAARIILLIAAAARWSAAPATIAPADQAETAKLDAELECMAKVVVHEAGNQSRRGQLAVAQLIMNRIESGRFPTTACGVANQRGQFFSTASYNPPRDSGAWASAVDVSRQARHGDAEAVAPGALFFHAAYASADSFFRTRQRVATLGDHIFYR